MVSFGFLLFRARSDQCVGAPKPTAATFSRMIKAFCDAGDVGTAYAWFERLRTMGSEF